MRYCFLSRVDTSEVPKLLVISRHQQKNAYNNYHHLQKHSQLSLIIKSSATLQTKQNKKKTTIFSSVKSSRSNKIHATWRFVLLPPNTCFKSPDPHIVTSESRAATFAKCIPGSSGVVNERNIKNWFSHIRAKVMNHTTERAISRRHVLHRRFVLYR